MNHHVIRLGALICGFIGQTEICDVWKNPFYCSECLFLTSVLFLPSWVCVCGFHPDVPAPEQPELFLKKLQQCCTVFDFMDTLSDLKMKEYKRSTLNELVDYVTVSRGYLTEQAYPEVVKMVSGRGFAGLLLQRWKSESAESKTLLLPTNKD